MGILDHSRTWHFETSASPADCVQAFAGSLGGRGVSMLGSHWNVTTSGDDGSRRAVATYEGRGGVAGALSSLSSRSQMEHGAAIGSELTFTASAGPRGTACTMGMTRVAKFYLFFTADARFFRSAMNQVARQLRANDAGLTLVKQ